MPGTALGLVPARPADRLGILPVVPASLCAVVAGGEAVEREQP